MPLPDEHGTSQKQKSPAAQYDRFLELVQEYPLVPDGECQQQRNLARAEERAVEE